MPVFSRKNMRSSVLAVTLGNIFEWYELYTYVYLAPVLAKLFFAPDAPHSLSRVFLIFGVGFLARPLGGIFFGRFGDTFGRRKALILSVLMMSAPTFILGLLPTYAQIGDFSTFLLVFVRLLQSFPAGGELPGAFCYLFESAPHNRRRFLTSFGAMGNQLGVMLALIEALVFESFFTYEQLEAWGWRVAFIFGSMLGLGSFIMRYLLHETPLFQEIEENNKITREPVWGVFKDYRKKISKGILYCIVDSVTFSLLSSLLPIYFSRIFGLNYKINIVITILFLFLATILLPLFGLMGDYLNNKKMLIFCCLGIIVFSFLISNSLYDNNSIFVFFNYIVILFFMTCITALIPYLLSHLFPTQFRFTCVAFSFNIVDGIIGGFTPLVTLILIQRLDSNGMFAWILTAAALISLCAYLTIPEGDPRNS